MLSGFFGCCLLMAMPSVYAQEQGMHSGQRIQEVYKQLNLTDEQKKALEINKEQHRATMQHFHQEMKINRQALQAALMNPRLDMAKIHELHARIKAVLCQMEDVKLTSILAVRSILTPQQFSEFISAVHKHRQEK